MFLKATSARKANYSLVPTLAINVMIFMRSVDAATLRQFDLLDSFPALRLGKGSSFARLGGVIIAI